MNTCLNCGASITQTVGKREKKYCSSKCRLAAHLKRKKETPIPPKEEPKEDNFVFPDGLDDIQE